MEDAMPDICILGYTPYQYLISFIVFSFLGWCVQVGYHAVYNRTFHNNGMLLGPFCPIYGFGTIVMMICVQNIQNIFVLTAAVFLLNAVLELSAGFLIHLITHNRLWNYEHERYNFHGYICLKFTLIWTVCGLIAYKLIIPMLFDLIDKFPEWSLLTGILIFYSILLLDIIVSFITFFKLNKKLKNIDLLNQKISESSNALSKSIREDVADLKQKLQNLVNQNWLQKRLLHAFPNLRSDKHGQALEQMRRDLRKQQKNKTPKPPRANTAALPFAHGIGFYKLFWLFMFGCATGVLIETLYCLYINHYIESRVGLLYGPFNCVYGIGVVILTLCLYKLQKTRDLWVFFISMMIGGVFEYVCSLVQEYAFGTVSWNYENSRSSIGSGRTNLLYAFFWGILGLIWIKELYPRVSRLIEKAPKKIAVAVTWIMVVFMVFNITVSILASTRHKERQLGLPASNQLEEYLDAAYDDVFMEKKFPNAVRLPDPSEK